MKIGKYVVKQEILDNLKPWWEEIVQEFIINGDGNNPVEHGWNFAQMLVGLGILNDYSSTTSVDNYAFKHHINLQRLDTKQGLFFLLSHTFQDHHIELSDLVSEKEFKSLVEQYGLDKMVWKC